MIVRLIKKKIENAQISDDTNESHGKALVRTWQLGLPCTADLSVHEHKHVGHSLGRI